ncbi:MAG: ABC transporter permease [Bdellovibrionales bacterium]|jgi:putative ABC transport system permease protein|nr:ABC transporter permease [Bdellovibrionales bacterium]MBT3526355.1 ABC transporter permease [Bdellovibrionales bacterium]MBT7668553.1 ABC transporter permease [Bdellovibrionales bacterium]MBT7766038.1 ABC transporter permease [Bdellovibrionales bacterium]
MILKMAYRNIIRNRRRSILTGMAMATGFAMMSISFGFSDGSYQGVIEAFTKSRVGHVQIHNQDYLENPSIYKTISEQLNISSLLATNPMIRTYAPRIHSGGLSFFNNKSMGIRLIGIDPQLEDKATTIGGRIIRGNYLKRSDLFQVMISKAVADLLKIGLGDKLVLISQGVDGSIANDLFTVTAIMEEQGSGMAYIPIKAMQEFLGMQGRVHEYVIYGHQSSDARKLATDLQQRINLKTIDVQPWQVVERDFYTAMRADEKGNYVLQLIIVVIVAVGILNAVLMGVLERTREFGVIKAIGTPPRTIFWLIMLEMILLAMISILVGGAIGVAGNYYFMIYGIEYSTPINFGGMVISRINGTINLNSLLTPTIVTFVTAVLVSIWPGIRAAKVIPVQAMRSI